MQSGSELQVAALTAQAAVECEVDGPEPGRDLEVEMALRLMFTTLSAEPAPEHLVSLADILDLSGLVPSLLP